MIIFGMKVYLIEVDPDWGSISPRERVQTFAVIGSKPGKHKAGKILKYLTEHGLKSDRKAAEYALRIFLRNQNTLSVRKAPSVKYSA